MARFIGTIEDYEKFIGPRIRNIVNTLAKSERNKKNGICEFCKKKSELQSAHKHGKGRKELIYEAMKKYDNGSYLDIDLEECETEIIELHKPLNQVFYFLCMECHRKYDSKSIVDENEESNNDFSVKKIEDNETTQKTTEIKPKYDIRHGGQIILLPDKETFRKNLLKRKKANWTITYENGEEEKGTWIASNFTESSNVIGNIRGGYLRDWKNKKIMKAVFEVEI